MCALVILSASTKYRVAGDTGTAGTLTLIIYSELSRSIDGLLSDDCMGLLRHNLNCVGVRWGYTHQSHKCGACWVTMPF